MMEVSGGALERWRARAEGDAQYEEFVERFHEQLMDEWMLEMNHVDDADVRMLLELLGEVALLWHQEKHSLTGGLKDCEDLPCPRVEELIGAVSDQLPVLVMKEVAHGASDG